MGDNSGDNGGLFDGFDFNDIIKAGLAVYGTKQGQKAPKFFVAPQTPEEKWVTQAKQGLFGSSSAYVDQYLHGLSNLNPDYKLNTNLVGNPAFMGGVHVPTMDFSKIPSMGGGLPATTGTTGTTDTSGGTDGTGRDQGGTLTKQADPGGLGGLAGGAFDGFDPQTANSFTPEQKGGLQQAWQWMQEHPNVVKGGAAVVAGAIAALGGPLAAALAKVGINIFSNWFNNRVGSIMPGGGAPHFQNGDPIGAGDFTPGEETLPTRDSGFTPSDFTPAGANYGGGGPPVDAGGIDPRLPEEGND